MNHGLLNGLVIVSLTILFLALLLKRAKQPYFIAYIIPPFQAQRVVYNGNELNLKTRSYGLTSGE